MKFLDFVHNFFDPQSFLKVNSFENKEDHSCPPHMSFPLLPLLLSHSFGFIRKKGQVNAFDPLAKNRRYLTRLSLF